ncbi:hypothetical protein [Microbulbifer thermotolerans]|uniref:hypothetical protein n=1 Tax=Microbulbifer thermotolerans TaxID=252514 RepID=UPI00224B936F|nr:hypothetical protein [Microbulbifer thermotolerans]MCX2834476.1 hypothetical protein [Microbulbifer thermotolerans]
MKYRFAIGDRVILSCGNVGEIVFICGGKIEVELKDGSTKSSDINGIRKIRSKFFTESDAWFHAFKWAKESHCELCSYAKLYSLELLDKDFVRPLFPNREEFIVKGILGFLNKEYSSCCYHLMPQVEGKFCNMLQQEGFLTSNNKGFPKWSENHPDEKYRNNQCKNIVEMIKGAQALENDSQLSHVYNWLGKENVECLRRLRNKLLHGQLVNIEMHDAALIIMALQSISHGIDGETEITE